MSNVKNFGATGDGQTDDTEAILHAIKDGDGLLTFPKGTYRITRPLEIDPGLSGPIGISGSSGTATLVMAGPGPAIRFAGSHEGTGSPHSVKPGTWNQERMPLIRDLAIEGEHPEANGIESSGAMQLMLEGLLIRRVHHGLHLVRRNRNIIVSNCHIYHNRGVGIFMENLNLHQINIIGSHLSYNRLGGIRIEGSEIRNLQITGNDLEYNNTAQSYPELQTSPTAEIWIDTTKKGSSVNEVTIASNTIQATSSSGGCNIRIKEKRDASRPPGLIAITGNIIGSQETNIHLTSCYGVSITGNSIYSCTHRNLLVEDSNMITVGSNHFRRHTEKSCTGVRFYRSRDCTISACCFLDESTEGQRNGASLLELDDCDRITVTGCTFTDGAPHAIHGLDCRSVLISACILTETRQTKVAKATVHFEGSGTGNLLSACSVEGPVTSTPQAGLKQN